MPIPFLPVAIPVAAALGAGALGYLVGRESSESSAGETWREDLEKLAEEEREEAESASGPVWDGIFRGAAAAVNDAEAEGRETPAGQPADEDETDEPDRAGEAGFAFANLTRADALRVLELPPDAGSDAIREAHGRLIQRTRPDEGGSGYLAAIVDRAREVLLG